MSHIDDDISDKHITQDWDDPPKRKGSVIKAIGIGIAATLVFELLVGILLNTQTNLVHRYIAYMLGIAVLFFASMFAQSVWKMFLLGTPVIVGVSFVLPLFLPDYFSGLMAPFVNIIPVLLAVIDSLNATSSDVSDLKNYANLVKNYGFVLDLGFAMVVGTFASIGLTGFIKLFTNKFSFFTIISIFFSIIFFLLGVVILPYFLVVASGFSQFGLTLGAGAINLSNGMTVLNNGTITDAQVFFDEAQKWFDQSDEILSGLESMKAFTLLGSANPDYKTIVDNLLVLVKSGVDLAQGIVPVFLGVNALQAGIQESMDVLNAPSTTLSLSKLSDSDIVKFEAGITLMKQGFANFSVAIPTIKDAVTELGEFNKQATVDALAKNGIDGGTTDQFDLIDGGVVLINAALDVFNVLITPANSTVEEPLVHLLRGALALTEVQDLIGTTTSFEGTAELFGQVIGNLTIVLDIFDDPAFVNFENADVKGVQKLIDVRDQISGIFKFVEDSGNVAIALGNFGISATPALTQMNSTMTLITSQHNFTAVDESTYDTVINNFEKSGGIVDAATKMRSDGAIAADLVDVMRAKAGNNTYGFMSDGANEFVSVFDEFDLRTNGNNFYYISNAFMNVMKTARELKTVDALITNVQGNVTALQNLNLPADNSSVPPLITNIENDVDTINVTLTVSTYYIELAGGNFSLVQNMPQLTETGNVLKAETGGIPVNIANIQKEMINIKQNATLVVFLLDPPGTISNITDSLNKISFQFNDPNEGINAKLSKVSIDAS